MSDEPKPPLYDPAPGHEQRGDLRRVARADTMVIQFYNGESWEDLVIPDPQLSEVERDVERLVGMWTDSPGSRQAVRDRYPGLGHALDSLLIAWNRRDEETRQ